MLFVDFYIFKLTFSYKKKTQKKHTLFYEYDQRSKPAVYKKLSADTNTNMRNASSCDNGSLPPWVIFRCFCRLPNFSKLAFSKLSFRNTTRVSNSLDLDHARRSDYFSFTKEAV